VEILNLHRILLRTSGLRGCGANRDAGRTQQRVHVVTEPLTDYLAYELTWEYGLHAAAGEDIRIIPLDTDHATVVMACFTRDAALHQAMPWAEYMTRHPDLVRRLPKGT
jgi:hypothetical protein